MTLNDIRKDLRHKRFYPIYFLQGSEAYYIDQITHYLEQHILSEDEKSFNQLVVYGKDTDIETIITHARRYPMMAPYQVVVVKEAQHIKDILRLETYAKNPLKTTILILNYKNKKIRGTTKLAKLIKKNGVLFTSESLRDYQIPAWIKKYLNDRKYKIEEAAIQLLNQYLGTDLAKIANELDKLMLNVPREVLIRKQHIADNIGISKDYNVFELQNALVNKDLPKAMQITNYFGANPKAGPLVMVISMLYRFYSKLYLYLHVKNRTEKDILSALNFRNSWFLKDFQAASRKYSIKQVKKAIELLHVYDLKSKGVGNISTSQGELMKEMVIRLIL